MACHPKYEKGRLVAAFKFLDGGGTGIRTPDTWIMIPLL
jgi:hypothetical protein